MVKGVWIEAGTREIIYLSLYCHHQNHSYIKKGSNESNFNVFINCERQSPQDSVQQTTIFSKRKENRNLRPPLFGSPLSACIPAWSKHLGYRTCRRNIKAPSVQAHGERGVDGEGGRGDRRGKRDRQWFSNWILTSCHSHGVTSCGTNRQTGKVQGEKSTL